MTKQQIAGYWHQGAQDALEMARLGKENVTRRIKQTEHFVSLLKKEL